jgi:hypothetical protein
MWATPNKLEIRRWDDLELVDTLPSSTRGKVQALSVSPDGHWLVLTDDHEAIYVISLVTHQITAKVEGGEVTASVLFNPTSQIMAAACSFQGGGYIRIDQINHNTGELIPITELDRCDTKTTADQFVDTLESLAISPNSRWLALYETSRIYHDYHPNGWRGNIVLYSIESKKIQWQVSIDGNATKDYRSLKEIGYGSGFSTQLLFLDNETIVCGSTAGNILYYKVSEGELYKRQVINPQENINKMALDKTNGILWVLLDNGELRTVSI